MFFIQFDKHQYSFFHSFGFRLVNKVSDQTQVSISADKSFGFQSRLKTFLVGRFLSGDKKSDKNRLIFHDKRQIIVGRSCRPKISADKNLSCVMGFRSNIGTSSIAGWKARGRLSILFLFYSFSFLCICLYCTAPLSPRKGRLGSFLDDDDDDDDYSCFLLLCHLLTSLDPLFVSPLLDTFFPLEVYGDE